VQWAVVVACVLTDGVQPVAVWCHGDAKSLRQHRWQPRCWSCRRRRCRAGRKSRIRHRCLWAGKILTWPDCTVALTIAARNVTNIDHCSKCLVFSARPVSLSYDRGLPVLALSPPVDIILAMMIVWNKRGNYQNGSVLWMTVVHSDTHTHEQFLKLTVGLSLVFVHLFSTLCVFLV